LDKLKLVYQACSVAIYRSGFLHFGHNGAACHPPTNPKINSTKLNARFDDVMA
jgi:hypothetical protein